MNCSHCHTALPPDARFCHQCGTEVIARGQVCASCQTENLPEAKFCIQCGQPLQAPAQDQPAQAAAQRSYVPRYPVTGRTPSAILEQLKAHFFQALQERVTLQSTASKYGTYVDVYYDSGFHYHSEAQLRALVDILLPLVELNSERAHIRIDQLLDDQYEALLDRFTIEHTKHLNLIQLSNSVLRYEAINSPTDLPIDQLIFDYLDLDREHNEKIYTNFKEMPLAKIKNASQHFLFPARNEPILVIGDQTLFGSCKEGFAFTTAALYWKAHFNKAQRVYFTELYDIEREEEWLNINGQYFHVSPSLNFKITKLLRKLQALFA